MALRYWLIIIILGVGWGMSFMFNAILLREFGPFTIAAGRVGFGALGCWIYLVASGRSGRLPVKMALALAAFGALSYAAPFTFYALGQQHIASGVAGIVNATTPAFAVVVSHFWPGGERATTFKTMGVLCGVMGIVVLSLPLLQQGQGTAVWAVIITMGAPVCYAFSVNLSRMFLGIDRVAMVAWALLGGFLCQLPLVLVLEGVPQSLSVQALGSFVFIGFVLTAAAFIVFYWVLPKVGPTNITLPTMIAPASALFFGSFILREPLGWSHAMGFGLILFGLLLIDGRLFRARLQKA
ncbi:EamA family transporter [Epibacterium sp. SM1969]|uniref:EamA family transporter n=1 Tax=Tritonibacter aquimaris TaxID=2663379 RepID=A0A844AUQ4_9RHOB|nr:DMT family transporter [Tritonibacter aquimaris]MQY42144.1 EamA family transporter [Tritonibacter aquimaris]